MKSLARVASGIVLLAAFGATPSSAGTVETQSDGSSVWQAGIDGVEIEWSPDGSFNRIYSKFTQSVAFPDQQGIGKSQTIAEEKAKAAIIRFMDQQVATARVTAEVQNDMNKSSRTRADGKDEISKTSQRQSIENLTEVTSSAAAGRLRGVIVLERGYDQKAEAVWVKVGVSKKTMASAQSLKNALAETSGVSDKPAAKSDAASSMTPGSHVQRSEQKDW
jgi:hypothetical protein